MKDKKHKGGKKAVIGAAIVQGALAGLSGDALYAHIQDQRPATGNKAIAKAGLLALSDPALTDRAMLDAVYDMAAKLRFAEPVPVIAAAADLAVVAEVKPGEDKPEKKRGKKVA